MKKLIGTTLLAGTSIALLAACGDFDEELDVLTGGEQGAYYPLGGHVSNLINDHVDNFDANHYSTGASVVNINDVADGNGHIAFSQNDTAYYAEQGGNDFFEESVDGVKGLATLYPEVIQIVATTASGIESVSDLEGMSVAVGDVGSGTEVVANQILEAHDITYDDFSVEYQDFGDAADSLQDGNIDAAIIVAGTPTGAIEALSAQADITLVNVEADAASALLEEYPFYTEYTVEESYGLDDEIDTLAVQAMLVAQEELEDEVVYDILTAIFDNEDTFTNAHQAGNFISLDSALDGMSIELHSGAEQFYNENQ